MKALSSSQPNCLKRPRGFLPVITCLLFCCAAVAVCRAQTPARATTLAVLDFGETETGRLAADRLQQTLAAASGLRLSDRDEARAAARGIGYQGSLNMTTMDARNLGASTGADFFITGDAQTLRRSPSTGPVYYESYASIFLVSSRTGRLVMWERPSHRASTPDTALKLLLDRLASDDVRGRYLLMMRRAEQEESAMRQQAVSRSLAPVIEEAPEDQATSGAQGLRLPLPYRRLRPAYPETAARAEAEATVDVEVDITTDGEVSRVEVIRWAGFGLDEATVETVRQMHFRPAIRDGRPIPMRVLLRYNFRKPPINK